MEKENKYTQEEINAILDEVNRKMDLKLSRKLTSDELENVSGGTLDKVMAFSHQEIDKIEHNARYRHDQPRKIHLAKHMRVAQKGG